MLKSTANVSYFDLFTFFVSYLCLPIIYIHFSFSFFTKQSEGINNNTN